MSAVPLADAPALAHRARRTTLVRLALAALAATGLLLALLASRHPGTRSPVPLAIGGKSVVVLDLSASISTDAYAQIGGTLSALARGGGSLGLVLFSDEAYEALPQGTPAADLLPFARVFTPPRQTRPGFAPTLPPNPWTASFSGGTRISAGLALAHTLAARPGRPSSPVVLVSDLSDAPGDLRRLGAVLLAFRRDRVPVQIVALDAAPRDVLLFRRALRPRPRITPAPPPAAAATGARTPFPWRVALGALGACAALAAGEAWGPRLSWGRT